MNIPQTLENYLINLESGFRTIFFLASSQSDLIKEGDRIQTAASMINSNELKLVIRLMRDEPETTPFTWFTDSELTDLATFFQYTADQLMRVSLARSEPFIFTSHTHKMTNLIIETDDRLIFSVHFDLQNSN